MCVNDECGTAEMSRRRLIAGATSAAVGIALGSHADAGSPLGAVSQASVPPASVPPTPALDDPELVQGPVTFPCGGETLHGYLAHPRKRGRCRPVLVLHGNFGLPDVARYTAALLAHHGFAALALQRFARFPGLTPEGVAQSDRTDRRFRSKAFTEQELIEAIAAIRFLTGQPFTRGERVGIIGYCGGGVQALWLAAVTRAVQAAAVFHAPASFASTAAQFSDPRDPKPGPLDMVDQIEIPVQGHYGSVDRFCPLEDVTRFEQALRQRGRVAEFHVYEGADHAFCDYTGPHYQPAAAALAWARTVKFLRSHLD